jgi:hypothetical protein
MVYKRYISDVPNNACIFSNLLLVSNLSQPLELLKYLVDQSQVIL